VRVIIAYDVTSNGARVKLANVLSSIGDRLQKSVFMCDTDLKTLDAVLKRADQLIDHRTDSIHVFPLCERCESNSQSFGQAFVPQTSDFWVL
jgi:CRISPR-associated protein Cas2